MRLENWDNAVDVYVSAMLNAIMTANPTDFDRVYRATFDYRRDRIPTRPGDLFYQIQHTFLGHDQQDVSVSYPLIRTRIWCWYYVKRDETFTVPIVQRPLHTIQQEVGLKLAHELVVLQALRPSGAFALAQDDITVEDVEVEGSIYGVPTEWDNLRLQSDFFTA